MVQDLTDVDPKANCRNGNDRAPPQPVRHSDRFDSEVVDERCFASRPGCLPDNVTRRLPVGYREDPPRQPCAKRALPLTTDPSNPPNVPQKLRESHERGRKASSPPTAAVIQRRRAKSRSPVHKRDPTLPQPSPHRRPNCREWLEGNCLDGPKCPFVDPVVRSF